MDGVQRPDVGWQQRSELRSRANTCDAGSARQSDAVRLELEHRDGQAMAVLLPYKEKRLNQGIGHRLLREDPADQHVWT